jgi:hypothetical protein
MGTRPSIGGIALIIAASIVLPVALWKLSDDDVNPTILIAALGLYSIIILSVIIMLSRKNVSLLNPFLYETLIYFIPASIGAVNLGFTAAMPSYERLLPEYEHFIIIALLYLGLSYVSLWIGFRWCNATSARGIAHLLPHWNWTPESVILPALIVLVVGDLCLYAAFRLGAVGFVSTVSEYGEILVVLSLLGTIGTFYLCWSFFRVRRKTVIHYILALIILTHAVYVVVTGGGKGTPIALVLLIMMAYYASGRHLSRRGAIAVAVIASLSIIGGVAYGTGFRLLMGSERQATLTEYIETAQLAMTQIGSQDVQDTLPTTLRLFLMRCDRTSTLAVVIARHDELKNSEEEWGLSNNIIKDTLTSVIPRFLWNNKPMVADARSLSLLYFNVPDTSFTFGLTGDLFRNAGIFGIVVGMAFLGAALKYGYSTMVTNSESIWARCTYCVILTSINFEGFYSGILPVLFRVALICLLAGVFMQFVIRMEKT